MKNDWRKVRLGDIIDFNPKENLSKGTFAKKVSMEHLYPYTKQISGYEISSFSGGSKFRNGDTIMARITPCLENGKTAQVNVLETGEIGFGSTEFVVLREMKNISDNNFIYYLTISPALRDIAIKSMIGTSGRQRVQQDVIENLNIFLPPFSIQQSIASILSCLDDKIELNRKINDYLEQMAQAVFKSWFVDFEPFSDGEFVDSELGKIPRGWRVGTLGEVAKMSAGGDKPKLFSKTQVEGCTIPIYSNGIDDEGLFGYTDIPKIFSESVTVSARGTIGYTYLRLHPYVPIVRLVSLEPIPEIVSSKYLYLWLLNSHITGTGTTQQQLTVPDFNKQSILLPSYTIMEKFTNIVTPLFAQIEANKTENLKVAAIRDTLLPKLMSGEIEVKSVP
ncbi:type I restriction endonuclease subunit S [Spirochaetia bacterium]|nr:type I restriction endonuclease subunit S [Spirochaetia bacterium]